MSTPWNTVRVFISSTFRDMHAERNHLMRLVFPELKAKCRELRIELIDVDLRWGVSEADANDGKVLDICLDLIDTCRPFFLGLLGYRYGFTPEGNVHSITAEEIYHGVLHRKVPQQILDLKKIMEEQLDGKPLTAEQKDCLSKNYLYDANRRKYLLRPNVPPEDLPIIQSVFDRISAYQANRSFFFFRSEALTKKLAGKNQNDFFETEPIQQDKVEKLKQEIICNGMHHFEYDDLDTFGEKVKEILWERIEQELQAVLPKEKDWLEQEAEFHEVFMAERTRLFVGRRDLLDKMHSFCTHDTDPSILLITGEPGNGKSALMAEFTKELSEKHSDWLILPHFVGASPDSTSIRQTLRRFCEQIYRSCNLETEKRERLKQIPEDANEENRKAREAIEKEYAIPADYRELLGTFQNFLKKAGASHRVVIILDAVNQFAHTDEAHKMHWLPYIVPENVRFVMSTLPGETQKVIVSRRVVPQEEILNGLTPEQIEELVDQYLNRIQHKFPNEKVRQLFLEKVKSGNPLYILVALDELRLFESFDDLEKRITEFPASVQELFDQVLTRIEKDFFPSLVRDCMVYIACGRYGMTAPELQTLLKIHAPADSEKLPDMLWSKLYRSFGNYLFERSGVIDFFHGQLKEAVGLRYLKKEVDRIQVHKTIAVYYESRWNEPYARALGELPHQLAKARLGDELIKLLSEYGFLEAKTYELGVQPLMEDYEYPRDSGLVAAEETRKTLQLIQGALRLSVHVLAKDKAQLSNQLLGRMLGFDQPEICRLLDGAKHSAHTPPILMQPITPCLTPPGGPLLRILSGHTGSVNCVALTADGRYAVSGSADQILKVWNLETGNDIQTFHGHALSINCVVVTADGRCAVSASGSWDSDLKIWELETGKENPNSLWTY